MHKVNSPKHIIILAMLNLIVMFTCTLCEQSQASAARGSLEGLAVSNVNSALRDFTKISEQIKIKPDAHKINYTGEIQEHM